MIKRLLTALIVAILIASYAPSVYAQATPSDTSTKHFIIAEIQANGPGAGTTTQEFIELYNNSDTPLYLAGWSIVFKNSSQKETVLYTFGADNIIVPREFVVGKNSLTAATYLPDIVANFVYTLPTSGLPASSGSIIIKNPELEVVDSVSWSNETAHVDDNTISGVVNGLSLQRLCLDDTTLITDKVPTESYYVDTISPLSLHCLPLENDEDEDELEPQTPPASPTTPGGGSTQGTIVQPLRTRLPIRLNELFIDPTAPLTDANDEYVELFNPHAEPIDMAGYSVIAGTTTKYRYTFPSGTVIAPQSFLVVTSAMTPLSLSNSGTTVEILNDLGQRVDAISYEKAMGGEAWALNSNGAWVWTTSPTMGAGNIITIKPVSSATTKTTIKKTTSSKTANKPTKKKTNYSVALPIQLNEIFPDPASPQTDAKDEFIELYNPHPMAINITDYTITAGSTKQYRYTFPEGSVIAPGGYIVIDSADTSVSLSNSGGTVKLLNNFDKEIDAVTYTEASSGQSYARDELGKWQWTTTVTKLGPNSIVVASGTKGSTTKVAGATAKDSTIKLQEAPQPLPGWVLALLGVTAVCYAAYEYRYEARNYFNKFSRNRTAG